MIAPSRVAHRQRVLLTRSEDDCVDWAARLAQQGAEAVAMPCIRTEPIASPALKAALAAALAETDWLVFTSRRGVDAFFALAPSMPREQCRIAVVGAATAEAAKAALGRVDLVGAGGTAASLAASLVDLGDLTHHPRVLLALAENAGDTLERALGAAGARCTRIDVYRTVPAPPAEPRRPLSALRVDNVVLASPSAVTGFVNQVDVDAAVNVYTIGPSTTAAARRAGLAVTAEAREPSLEGIMEAMRWRI
jgi:uroporphyrinogen-III synthase